MNGYVVRMAGSGKRIETRIGGLPDIGSVVYQVSYVVLANGSHDYEVLLDAHAANPRRVLTNEERDLLRAQENLL
jgi:hypothetical protein